MRAFAYLAYTDTGKSRRGTLLAESERDAAEQLKAQGLFAAEITSTTPGPAAQGGGRSDRRPLGWHRRHRLDADMRVILTRQLAVLIGSELTADAALEVVVQSGGGGRLSTFATEVRAQVLDGHPLSAALQAAGGGFERYFISALRAGETAGDLATVLDQLAEHLETRSNTRSQLATALAYPAFVAAVSILVAAVLLTNVAPEIVAMFQTTGRPLPALTVFVLAIADWVRDWGLVAGIVMAGLGTALAILLRLPRLREAWQGLWLRVPVVGGMLRLAASVQYLRTLALVLGSRQTVIDAARSATEVVTLIRFRREAEAVVAAVEAGASLSDALAKLSALPPVARHLILAGERSARLPRMADRAALLVETWQRDGQKRLATVIDPLLMMVVGAMVLVIVLAVLLPIFDLQAAIS